MNTSSGSATKPVSRSSTTEANAIGDESTVVEARGDPQHVAADRRRQDVADEQAREVVADQRAQRHSSVEHEQHPLPAPGRQDDAEQRHEQRRGRAAAR